MALFFFVFLLSILAIAIGFIMGRYLSPKHIKQTEKGKTAFLMGFRYLLSKEADRAIEAFMKVVYLDTETVETYFALANLFRDKGEIERSIRIHQSIITRPHLDEALRIQALYDLALDYKKAGLFDRAINTFKEIVRRRPQKKEAYLELANLYQSLKDWEAAYVVIDRLEKITGKDYSNILAHFQTEEGKKEEAEATFKKAIKINKNCVDAYLHLGDLYFEQKSIKNALNIWEDVIKNTPEYSFLVYQRLKKNLLEVKEQRTFLKIIKSSEASDNRGLFSSLFLGEYYLSKKDLEMARHYVNEALENKPNYIRARQLLGEILLEENKTKEAISLLREVGQAVTPQKIYQCSQCGYEANEILWRCPQCELWDTIRPKIEI
jgi:lipopolysaccharide biosynthesis regulator YciM